MAEYNSSHPKTAGEALKEMRESKGISLLTVHEATKIPLDALKAIEEGYSVRTLSSFYLKGFIKMYAEYLGADVSRILDRPIPVLEKKKEAAPKMKMVQEKVYRIPDGEFDLNKIVSKEQQRQIVKVVGILIGIFFLVRIAGCLFSKKEKPADKPAEPAVQVVSPKAAAEQKLIVNPAASKSAVVQPAAVKPAAVQPAAEVSAAVQERSDKIRLAVKVLKGGWLQVRVDGDIVVESTLNAGTVKRWEADNEIVISGRMIHNLEFELNGKMLGTLGRKDRNAHRVVVTKKGLSVSD